MKFYFYLEELSGPAKIGQAGLVSMPLNNNIFCQSLKPFIVNKHVTELKVIAN